MQNHGLSFNQSENEEASWQVDQLPGLRLAGLFAVCGLLSLVVGWRLFSLGQTLKPTEREARIQQVVELLPTRDGRILSADGQVLAEDVQLFEIEVHYRWIEDPPHAAWLRKQALSQLSATERRNREQVELAEQKVLEERDQLWLALGELCQLSAEQLSEQRQRIQYRVERIREHVEKRRKTTRTEMEEHTASVFAEPLDVRNVRNLSWWKQRWQVIQEAVTTAPPRATHGPLILKEELDFHPLLGRVPLAIAAEIESRPERFPGVRVQMVSERTYPHTSLAAHLLGNRLPIKPEKQEETEPGTRRGRTGLEKVYDQFLLGQSGQKKIARNSSGEILSQQLVREPNLGRDLVLTLDLSLQKKAEELLKQAMQNSPGDPENSPPTGACLVAMDVQTGALLAAAAAPDFDLNIMQQPTVEQWQQLTADTRKPMFPRITHMALPPGSVFKILTAIAGLENGSLTPEQKFACQGFLVDPQRHRCYVYRHYGVGHGPLTLTQALSRSCNVFFFQAANRMGPEPLIAWAERFEFGKPTGIDLPGEASGTLPRPNDKQRWYPGDTLGLAIGQSRLTTTPLQIVRMLAAVANDGYLVTPHLLRDVGPIFRNESQQNSEQKPLPKLQFPRKKIAGLSPETLKVVRQGLTEVVADPRGTGYRTVRSPLVKIAGKTGTAEVGGNQADHAWFAGFAPAENPRIAFVVVLEHGGSGSKAAGPLAKKFVEFWHQSVSENLPETD